MNLQDILNLILSFFNTGNTSTPANPSFNGTQLSVVRTHTDTFSTLGNFLLNGSQFCYCIELPKVSYDGSNVCIPCGTYLVVKYFSPDHGFDVLLLQNVPNRTSIEVHPANWAINPQTKQVFLLGCIAVGDQEDGTDAVDNSQAAFNRLMAAIDFTKPIQITITENF